MCLTSNISLYIFKNSIIFWQILGSHLVLRSNTERCIICPLSPSDNMLQNYIVHHNQDRSIDVILPALFWCYHFTCAQFYAWVCLVPYVSHVNMKSSPPVIALKSAIICNNYSRCPFMATHALSYFYLLIQQPYTYFFLHNSVSSRMSHKWGRAVYNLLIGYFSFTRISSRAIFILSVHCDCFWYSKVWLTMLDCSPVAAQLGVFSLELF